MIYYESNLSGAHCGCFQFPFILALRNKTLRSYQYRISIHQECGAEHIWVDSCSGLAVRLRLRFP